MASKVVLPKWGMGINEGTVLKWLKAEDNRQRRQAIVEIGPPRRPSRHRRLSGRLVKILVPEGDRGDLHHARRDCGDGENYADLLV